MATESEDMLTISSKDGLEKASSLLQTLMEQISQTDSATATLDEWCNVASGITAITVARQSVEATADQRDRLQVNASEPVTYRAVRLQCGETVLAFAENWYVPNRLTSDMRDTLSNTTIPFGRIISPLAPKRTTLSLEQTFRFSSAAETDEFTEQSHDPAEIAFIHSALVCSHSGIPLAEVRENFLLGAIAIKSG